MADFVNKVVSSTSGSLWRAEKESVKRQIQNMVFRA